MSEKEPTPTLVAELRHINSRDELKACYPVIAELRPFLKDADDWCQRAATMARMGYRVLVAWRQDRAVAVAGYRVAENLIHGRFLYVDDLVTAASERGEGLGAALLTELARIGIEQDCRRLVLDTAAANANARRFYEREGMLDLVVGFIKPLEDVA